MADAARGPVVGRPAAFASEAQRAVHSWSRISSAGHEVLLDALKILSPASRDPSDAGELLAFLQELSEEGHRPSVLRSKDVYAYRSCMSQPLTQDMLRPPSKSARPTAKRRGRRPLAKKREVHPSWSAPERASPRIQGARPPELPLDRRTVFCSRAPGRGAAEAPPAEAQPAEAQPCLRLTNIEGLSGFHTARLQIHTSWDLSSEAPPAAVAFPQQQVQQQQVQVQQQVQQQLPPPTFSGIPSQPSQHGGGGAAPTKAVALFSQKSLSCPIRLDGALIGDSAPVLCANGRAFPQTHTELTSNGWRSNGAHRGAGGGRRPRDTGGEVAGGQPAANGWKDKNGVRWKAIKVDDSRSVDEACRKAQKILQVNLRPVIQIQPLNHVLRDFRYQNK